MERHRLDPYPIPKEKTSLCINEPWLFDKSLSGELRRREPEEKEDNVRIYIPMDLNKDAILRRLDWVINCYGEANENNEFDFREDVEVIISQIEIYDQVWFVRHMPSTGYHCREAIVLVQDFVNHRERIPDGCAECFTLDVIEELRHPTWSRCFPFEIYNSICGNSPLVATSTPA